MRPYLNFYTRPLKIYLKTGPGDEYVDEYNAEYDNESDDVKWCIWWIYADDVIMNMLIMFMMMNIEYNARSCIVVINDDVMNKCWWMFSIMMNMMMLMMKNNEYNAHDDEYNVMMNDDVMNN